MKNRSNNDVGSGFYHSWADEEEAALLYCGEYQLSSNISDKETGVACIYEYTREILFCFGHEEHSANSFLELFSQRPFTFFCSEDATRHSLFDKFGKYPWIKLSLDERKVCISKFLYPYDEGKEQSNCVPVPMASMILRSENFERFRRGLFETMLNGDAASIDKMASQPAVIKLGEFVDGALLLVDYRNSKKALRQQFEKFLESRKERFEEFEINASGGRFFRDALKDLGHARLYRHHRYAGLTRLRKYSRLGSQGSYSEAKKRMAQFITILRNCRFHDLKEFELTHHRHAGAKPRP